MQKFALLTGMLLSVAIVNARAPWPLIRNMSRTSIRDRSGTEDTSRADATIKNATVYFGYGAELTHESRIKVNSNTKIIIINQLSTNVDINSLQISCPEDVALLSQRYRVFYPAPVVVEKNKATEKSEDSIISFQQEISRIENLIAIEQEVLTKTGTLIETTISTSGNKTVTSAEVLKLVDYYNVKIEKAKTNIFTHRQSEKK